VSLLKEIRAMDRRRFMPSTEGLETRALQAASSTNLANIFGFQVNTNLNIPVTFQQKELRIQHLPFYLEKILPGRFLPKAEVQGIQGDLFELISKTRQPPSSALNNYNLQLRQIVPHQSLNATNANVLNFGFGAVLHAATASPDVINGLKSNLFQLVTQVDTASPQPVFLASNDYTLVLETALAIGRPMPSPILPKIAKNQGIQANVDHIKTPLKHPAFVGTYHFHTHVQLVTASGAVLATSNCRPNNRYKLVVDTPLSPGVYQFRIRAYDDAGNLSHVSRLFAVKVVPRSHHA
jgi:hypothetical protein